MTKKYICTIYSDSSNGREYEVETSSAYKCADVYGRCEGGEVITVWNKSKTRQISRAIWTPEDGGKFIRVNVERENKMKFYHMIIGAENAEQVGDKSTRREYISRRQEEIPAGWVWIADCGYHEVEKVVCDCPGDACYSCVFNRENR